MLDCITKGLIRMRSRSKIIDELMLSPIYIVYDLFNDMGEFSDNDVLNVIKYARFFEIELSRSQISLALFISKVYRAYKKR